MEKGRYDRLSADDEEPFLSREAIHRVDFRRRRSLWKILPHVISILTIAVCGSLVGWKFMAKVTEHDILDPQSFFPKFPVIKRTFLEHDGHLNEDQKPVWNSIMPIGHGFINIPNPRQYDLPPGMPAEAGEAYSLAIWHQLHCLKDLRAALLFFRDGDEGAAEESMVSAHHVDHCFDYLRQTIECYGDTTIEWGRLIDVDGVIYGAVNGYGVTHQCRNVDAIRDFTIANRANNRTHGEVDYDRKHNS